MVRAGVVDHPEKWLFCGYNEIQDPPSRYRIIDLDCLGKLMGFTDLHNFQSVHKRWVETSLQVDEPERKSHWTESIAVGGISFIENVKNSLGFKAKGRSVTDSKGHYQLREGVSAFGNPSLPGLGSVAGSDAEIINTFFLDAKS